MTDGGQELKRKCLKKLNEIIVDEDEFDKKQMVKRVKILNDLEKDYMVYDNVKKETLMADNLDFTAIA